MPPKRINPLQPNQYRSRDIILDRQERRLKEQQALRDNFLKLHDFVEKVIGPWATQARISQLISEDFDEMALDKNVQNAVNVSFKNASSPTPQVGNSQFVYTAPSRFGTIPLSKLPEHNNVVHRGITEQEFFKGTLAVRLYVTLFKEVEVAPGGTTPYKDVHQDKKTGKITIYSGDKTPVLWVNAGQPLRALKWLEKYKVEKKPGAQPVIRSFCIPVSAYIPITQNAILEHDAGKEGNESKTFNVDRHYASDQFGIRGNALKTLQEKALPGSLITYADDLAYSKPEVGGEILLTKVLRDRLGVPTTAIQGANVFVDPTTGEFQKKDQFGGIADKLMNIYGCWFGNDQFITQKWLGIPRDRRCTLMREYLHAYGLYIPLEYWTEIQAGRSPATVAQNLRRSLK